MQTIEERVKTIYAEQFGVTPVEITGDHTCESLAGDSLDEVEIIMLVEDEFGIQIKDDDAEKLTTVQSMIDHVTAALA